MVLPGCGSNIGSMLIGQKKTRPSICSLVNAASKRIAVECTPGSTTNVGIQ